MRRHFLEPLLLSSLALFGTGAHAAQCGYANPTASGRYVDALCFFDLTDYDDDAASSAAGQDFSFVLPTGGSFSFNLRRTNGTALGGGTPNAPLKAVAIPTWTGAQLGNNNWYAGVPGYPVMYQTTNGTTSVLTFTNFSVHEPDGTPIPQFDFIAIDGETTTAPRESFSLSTAGTPWEVIDTSGTNILYEGLGTTNVTWHSPNGNASAPILRTRTPTRVVATMAGQGLQGMAFALAATTLVVEKTVVDPYGTGFGRAVPSDQFRLAITRADGSQFDQRGVAVTSGSSLGEQAERAQSLVYFEGDVRIGESMADGSFSALGIYAPSITCTSTSGTTTGLPTNVPGASVTLSTLNPVTFDLVRCIVTNTIPRPQVSIEKTINTSGDVIPGGTVLYTVVVTNTGQVSARNTVIQDDLPDGITAFSWTCLATGGAVCPHANGTGGILEAVTQPLTPDGLVFPPGSKLIYRIVATVDSHPPSRIINTASASPPHGTCFPDDSAPPCRATVVSSPGAVIAISKTTSTDVAIGGGSASYAVTVRNTGSVAADGTTVDDDIPAGLTAPFVWSCSANGGAVCPNASGSGAIHETIATFPVGAAIVYAITAAVVADPPAAIDNRAVATPPPTGICDDGGPPPCPAQVTIPAAPVIAIAKTASPGGVLGAGDPVVYTITVGNDGLVDANGTRVHDDFPNGIDNVTSWTCQAAGGAVCPSDGGGAVASPAPMLDQVVATFPPGGHLTWTFNAVVNLTPDPPPEHITNTAVAIPPRQGRCSPNYTPGPCAATVTNPFIPVVEISKITNTSLLAPGGRVAYGVIARNVGTTDAAGARVTDPIPTGLTTPFTWVCTASGGAACPAMSGNGALDVTLATFPAGGEVDFIVTATVAADPPAAVTNTATIAPPPGGVCNGDSPSACNVDVTLPVAPQIGVDKSTPLALAIPGQAFTWTVTVTNTGSTDASGTLVSDPLPPGIEPTSTSWSCTASGGAACLAASGDGLLNSSIPAFPPGSQVVYTLYGTVTANPPSALINTATATPPGSGRCAPNNSPPPCGVTVVTPTPPVVSIAKSTDYATGVPGTEVTFVVTVENVGSASADGTQVHDPVTVDADGNPNGLTAPISWTCTASNGAVCPNASGSGAIDENLTSFPSGGKVVYAITATVATAPPLAIVNYATATPPADGVCADGHAVPCYASALIVGTPSLGIAKSVSPSGPVAPGDVLTYTVTVSNGSNSFAAGALVHDDFPAGVASARITQCTGTPSSNPAYGSATCPPFDGTMVTPPAPMLDATIAYFPPGSSVTWTIEATLDGAPPDPVVNTATATPPLNGDCLPGNTPPPCAATAVSSLSPVLEIAKSANKTILLPGDTVTYTVTVRNTGAGDADGTVLGDPLPDGIVAFSAWTCAADGGAICPNASGSGAISETVATFPAGAALVYTITADIAAAPPAQVTNAASAAPPAGAICADGSAPPCLASVTVPVAPQVSLSKTVAQTQAVPGQPLTWTITVANTGSADASGTTVSDPLPAGVDAASATWSCAGACPTPASGSGAIDAILDSFPVGAQAVFTFDANVVAAPPMQIVNTATATPPPFGRCGPDDGAPPCRADTITPSAPLVGIAKSVTDASGDGIAQSGEQLTYRIVLHNGGGSDATGYGVTDPLDPNTTFVSADPPATLAGGALTWTGLTIPAGGNLTLTVVVTVNDTIPDGTTSIANLAYESGAPPPDCTAQPTPENCSSIPPEPPASVGVTKTANSDQLTPSGTVTYVVTVSNTGTTAAHNVRITDPVPAGIASFEWTCASTHIVACPRTTGSGALDETVASLPSGGRLIYAIIATLTAEPPDPLVNTANVSIANGTCDPCSASVTGHVGPPPPPPPPPPAAVDIPATDTWALLVVAALLLGIGCRANVRARRRIR